MFLVGEFGAFEIFGKNDGLEKPDFSCVSPATNMKNRSHLDRT